MSEWFMAIERVVDSLGRGAGVADDRVDEVKVSRKWLGSGWEVPRKVDRVDEVKVSRKWLGSG